MLIKPRKNRKGFTLIELIVVVSILAILAAVAIPAFVGLQDKAREGVYIADASNIVGAVNVYNSLYPDSKITATANAQATLTTAKLWPASITDVAKAMAKVHIDANGLATVDTTIS